MQDKLDLTPQPLKRPMLKSLPGSEAKALAGLVKQLNNPALTGAQVPRGVDPLAELRGVISQASEPVATPAPAPVPPPPPTPADPTPSVRSEVFQSMRFAFTGRLKAGKDFVAAGIGCKIHGFADPMYAVLSYFFNTANKDANGARAFLQKLGQWGRGTVNEEYPLTTERAVFVTMMQTLIPQVPMLNSFGVDWEKFGRDEALWVNALLKRVENETARIAVVNVRFPNERDALKAAGWPVFHVMCSPRTWEARLETAGLSSQSPVVSNYSEQLALAIDRDVTRQISQNPNGGKLRCVWNDDKAPPPSKRLLTLAEFKQLTRLNESPA